MTTHKNDRTRERTPGEIEMAAFLHNIAAASGAEEARQVARKADAEARQRTGAEAYAAMIASSDRSTEDKEAEAQS